MSDCLQYYYDNPEDAEKYKLSCDYKEFPEFNNPDVYTHSRMLNFIRTNYSSEAFPEDSPFEFKEDYIDLSNDDICKATDMSLGPQQKFMGQLMGPNTDFNNTLIFHGLGSGKSCNIRIRRNPSGTEEVCESLSSSQASSMWNSGGGARSS